MKEGWDDPMVRCSAAILLFFHTDWHTVLFVLSLPHLVFLNMPVQTRTFTVSTTASHHLNQLTHVDLDVIVVLRHFKQYTPISHNVKTPGAWREWYSSWPQYDVLDENPGSCYLCRCSVIYKTHSKPLKPRARYRLQLSSHIPRSSISYGSGAFLGQVDALNSFLRLFLGSFCGVHSSTHCPAEGPSPERVDRTEGVRDLWGTLGGWFMSVDVHPHEYQAPSTTLHCSKVIGVIHLEHHWF